MSEQLTEQTQELPQPQMASESWNRYKQLADGADNDRLPEIREKALLEAGAENGHVDINIVDESGKVDKVKVTSLGSVVTKDQVINPADIYAKPTR